MYKVRLVSKAFSNNLSNKDSYLKNFYLNYDAVIEYKGNNDGVYYVKNFCKDKFIILDGNESVDDLLKKGFQVKEKDIYKYNVLIKKKQAGNIYVVQPLENLNSICEKLSVSEEDVIKRNSLKSKNLFVGQRLIIDV